MSTAKPASISKRHLARIVRDLETLARVRPDAWWPLSRLIHFAVRQLVTHGGR